MPVFKITDQHKPEDLDGKHIVINCRTGDNFAADTQEESDALAKAHDKETAKILAQQKKAAGGRHGHS